MQPLYFVLILLAFGATPRFSLAQAPTMQEFVVRAYFSLDEKNYNSVTAFATEVLQKGDPRQKDEARYILQRAKLEQGQSIDLPLAKQIKAIGRRKDLAVRLSVANEFQLVVELLADLISSNDPEIVLYLGQAHTKLNNFQLAISCYQKHLQLAPQSDYRTQVLFDIARLHLMLARSRSSSSQKHFDAAHETLVGLESKFEDEEFKLLLGEAVFANGNDLDRVQQAADHFESVSKIKGQHQGIATLKWGKCIAREALEGGDDMMMERAISIASRVRTLDPTLAAESAVMIVRWRIEAGLPATDDERKEAEGTEAVEVELHQTFIRTMAAKKYNEALQTIGKLLEEVKKSPRNGTEIQEELRFERCRCLYLNSMHREVIEECSILVEFTKNVDLQYQLNLLLGRSLLELAIVVDAQAAFESAYACSSLSERAQAALTIGGILETKQSEHHAGYYYSLAGNSSQATSSEKIEAFSSMARLNVRRNELTQAISNLDQAMPFMEKRDRQFFAALQLKVKCLVRIERFDRSLPLLETLAYSDDSNEFRAWALWKLAKVLCLVGREQDALDCRYELCISFPDSKFAK